MRVSYQEHKWCVCINIVNVCNMNAQLCCLDIVERQETIPEMMQTF